MEASFTQSKLTLRPVEEKLYYVKAPSACHEVQVTVTELEMYSATGGTCYYDGIEFYTQGIEKEPVT